MNLINVLLISLWCFGFYIAGLKNGYDAGYVDGFKDKNER